MKKGAKQTKKLITCENFIHICLDFQLFAIVSQEIQNLKPRHSKPCKTSTMEYFAKIVNSCSCFCKLFSPYQHFTFSTFFNKSISFYSRSIYSI